MHDGTTITTLAQCISRIMAEKVAVDWDEVKGLDQGGSRVSIIARKLLNEHRIRELVSFAQPFSDVLNLDFYTDCTCPNGA